MKLLSILVLTIAAYGPCSRGDRPTAPAPRPAPTPPVAAPTPAPAAPAPRPGIPEGVRPGADAMAVTVAEPPTLIVQRASSHVALRLGSFSCEAGTTPGDGGMSPATTCAWRSQHCRGTLQASRMMAIGGSGTALVVTAEPLTGDQDEALCAGIAGTFEERHGGPVPARLPSVPNAACLSAVDARTLQSYVGACCVGRPVRRFTIAEGERHRWLTGDGDTLVAAARGLTLTPDDLRTNAVVLRVLRGEAPPRELRVRDVFAGDPILQGATGFSIEVRLTDALSVGAIGGPSHAVPLTP